MHSDPGIFRSGGGEPQGIIARMRAAALFLCLALAGAHAAEPSVSAGGWHSLALHRDGTVRSWGDDSTGALGIGRPLGSATPRAVAGLTGVVAVSAGGNHTVALKGDGTVWAWGANDNGELGDGSTTSRSVPVRVLGLDAVVQISAGRFFTMARKSDGSVWTWGSNNAGELGDDGGHRSLARQVAGLANVVEISAGYYHAVARTSDGSLWSWGLNGDGQLGDGTRLASYEGRSRPTLVANLRDVAQVSGGGYHTVARKTDGTVWAWGANVGGELGNGTTTQSSTPVQVGLANIVEISAGAMYSLARGADGSVWAWGQGGYGQIGDGVHENRPTPIRLFELNGVSRLAAGFLHSAALREDGGLFVWGHNANGQLGDGTTTMATRPFRLPGVADLSAVAVGLYHTVALKRDGTVMTWGDDSQGQLGHAVYTFRSTPEPIPGLSSVIAVSAGYLHSLALLGDGRVFAWGSNGVNQLTGDGVGSSTPRPVTGLANVVQIAAGVFHSLARLGDGTVRAFGSNYRGRLGNGNPDDFGPLSVVQGLSGVTHVSAGGGHSLAVRGDGSVWAWGENDFGQLGDGSTTDRFAPVRVAGLTDVVEVAAGPSHSLARKRDGTVWAWGRNIEGQLGDGSDVNRATPVQVRGLADVTALAAGRDFSVAVVNSRVLVWGFNYNGGLGCGACETRRVPMVIAGLDGVRAVSAMQYHVLAMRADGTVRSWGGGSLGQLGDGTLVDRDPPVVVLRERGAGSVAGNDWYLDLEPGVTSIIRAEDVPVFLVTAAASGNDISASIRPRPQDVGTTASLFVFALAPADVVRNAVHDPALPLRMTAKRAGKDTQVQCVLAQLTASGQLVGVSAANLQAYLTGVLSAQGAAVSILNGVPIANIGGATFFVGYGPNASSMLNGGTNRGVVTVPGANQCKPEPPQTGWWWNPAEDGRGFSIEKRGNNLFFASFLYDASGRSTWFVSSGPVSLDGSLYRGDLLSARGGQTLGGAYPGFPTLRNEGELSIAFNNASNGTLLWPGGAVPIQRFNIVPNGLTMAPAANQPESGWWWNEQESGRGFFMEWQGGTLDIAGYMYDESGNPVWYLTVGGMSGSDGRTFTGNWWSYGNGMTLMGPWRPHARTSDNVAPVTITFSAPDTAMMTLPNGRTTALRRHRF